MGRKPEELHPYLLDNFKQTAKRYAEQYPDDPQPFLTETRRSLEEQQAYYAQGREDLAKVNALRKTAGLGPLTAEENKRKVTNAKPGKTLHSVGPSLAYDIAFKKGKKAFYDVPYFKKFASLALEDQRIEWGGNWTGFVDYPHFQFRGVRATQLFQPAFDPIKFTNKYVGNDTKPNHDR
ncbi:hypothetical protein BWI93_27230 [Siphonobacter sp. BAB-5385]|uniref:M15 family metallopeptidase n=1 Tax=Siphonobacter sp. BAB-5385 TaxID=1864822 RepID=UPI000B9ECE52|nr:M15 family metallopeptidase [Siphonobacter sp. BAB-5385]OZI05109.1 hypothetical protein BWI93_27230 [Siphonobacter sp. BAB-5385]